MVSFHQSLDSYGNNVLVFVALYWSYLLIDGRIGRGVGPLETPGISANRLSYLEFPQGRVLQIISHQDKIFYQVGD